MSLDIAKVKDHLEAGEEVCVSGVHYFTQYRMECSSTREGYLCCEEDFTDVVETIAAILDYADSQEDEVELL